MNRMPKICFFLQRHYAHVGHALALWLKEKYGVREFCAYVGLRRIHAFLQRQQNITYTGLMLDEDVHNRYRDEPLDLVYLEWLEKKFGIPNLWPYLALDREIMSNQAKREYPYDTPRYTHEEMLRILQVTAKAVISFLDKERPDAIVFSTVGNVPGYLLYEIAKKRSIKVLYILTPSLGDRYVISEAYDRFTGVETLCRARRAAEKRDRWYDEAKRTLDAFRRSPAPYDPDRTPSRQMVGYRRQFAFLKPKNLWRSALWFSTLCYRCALGGIRNDYTTTGPLDYLRDHIARKARNLVGASDLYDAFEPEKPSAYFALGYEPEIDMLLLAPFACDQIELARRAALSLPVGWVLYIKEHPEMAQYRPRRYYTQLKKIPNVRLLSPSVNGFDVIKHARLIFTVTGTSAWEGLLLKKPAVVFGNKFYNALSMVGVCKNREELPALVKRQLDAFHYDEEELLQFIAAILEDSASLPFIELWEREFDEKKRKAKLEPLADLLAKKLGLAS